MGSINIFSTAISFGVTFFSLIIFSLACFYSSYKNSLSKGISYLFIGVVLEFCANWLGINVAQYQSSGFSVGVLVFIELLVLLLSMLFLGFAASQILVNNIPDTPFIAIIAGLGFVAVVYFVFISPDGDKVNTMRQIFTMAGFAYIAAALWSRFAQKNTIGTALAASITSFIALVFVLRLFSIGGLSLYSWSIPAMAYTVLAVALLMMRADFFARKVEDCQIQLEKYNQRIEDIIKSSPFPIIISRLSDDRLLLANNNAVKLFGIHEKELERYKLRDFFADADNRRLLNERLEQEKEVQDFEILVKTSTGDTPFWLLTSANVIDYNYDIAIYSAFQDITSRKNREVLLKNQATRDPLTSLFNRRYFEDEVNKRISSARINDQEFSVLMVDADHFKKVNDTYGHKVGDKVLIDLAATCEKALRADDIVARYGGEEFVIFLSKTGAEQAKIVADRLRETISGVTVYSEDGKPINFTVSIGISSHEVSDNLETLIKTADEALYRAKHNGRNRCEVFSANDLKTFVMEETNKVNSTETCHPIFAKEDSAEISLLDGIEATQIPGIDCAPKKP